MAFAPGHTAPAWHFTSSTPDGPRVMEGFELAERAVAATAGQSLTVTEFFARVTAAARPDTLDKLSD